MNYLQFLRRSQAAKIAQMFASGEQGLVYDIDNISTLFQDSAFTAPVTAVEQQVGSILDLSGRGNHATQATTPKRPIYSRRVNLFSDTEGQVVGDSTRYTCERVAGNSPPGTEGYIKVTATGVAAVPSKTFVAPSTSVAASFYIKKGSSSLQTAMLRNATTATNFTISNINVGTGAVTGPWSCSDAGNGWWKLSLVHTTGISPGDTLAVYLGSTAPSAAGTYWLLAGITATSPIDAHLPYQRVNTVTDYDADPAKFPAYLLWDGVDDAMRTGNIDFTGTDKMTVWAGITKLSDAGIICELGVFSNTGMYGTFSMQSQTGGYSYASRGTLGAVASLGAGYSAPNSSVLTGSSSISDDYLALKINGISAAQSTADQGSGNYGLHAVNIGARNGTSAYFNGRLYSLIVRGAQSSLSQIEATGAHTKQKMRLP